MRRATWLLLLPATLLAGCGTARDVAVTTFRVIDAPANYIRKKIDQTEGDQRQQPEQYVGDVETPGRPLPPQPTPPPPRVSSQTRPPAGAAPSPRPQPTPARTPRSTATNTGFPIAKPVPGRPGFVYSLDPKGGIVDVTGYNPGDKAKDPYTKQIFIVP